MGIPLTEASVPFVQNLKVIRGASYAAVMELYEDEGRTKPFGLAGWNVTLVPNGLPTMAVGGELSIPSPVSGDVNIALTPAQTSAYPVGKYHYVLWVVKTEGEGAGTSLTPVVGTLAVVNP